MRILFVCSGNTCRSPMAAVTYDQLSRQSGRDDEIRSRGVGLTGHGHELGSDFESVEMMRSLYQIDLSHHVPQGLTPQDVSWADLIVAMEPKYVPRIREFGKSEHTDLNGKVRSWNIRDPWGNPIEVYSNRASEIRKLVQDLIIELNGRKG